MPRPRTSPRPLMTSRKLASLKRRNFVQSFLSCQEKISKMKGFERSSIELLWQKPELRKVSLNWIYSKYCKSIWIFAYLKKNVKPIANFLVRIIQKDTYSQTWVSDHFLIVTTCLQRQKFQRLNINFHDINDQSMTTPC